MFQELRDADPVIVETAADPLLWIVTSLIGLQETTTIEPGNAIVKLVADHPQALPTSTDIFLVKTPVNQ